MASMSAVPPLEVAIYPAHTGPLSADPSSTFHCHAHGSQPPAAVTWFDFQGTKIKDATSEVKIDIHVIRRRRLDASPSVH